MIFDGMARFREASLGAKITEQLDFARMWFRNGFFAHGKNGLMVVDDFNVLCMTVDEAEADTILLIDADGVLAFAVAG